MKKLFRNTIVLLLCAGLFISMNLEAKAAPQAVVDPRPDYTVYVNRALNCVTVFAPNENGENVPVKAMVCSCGREGHETPMGVFQTSDYYDWRMMVDRTWGQYAVRFNGHILFHSVPYFSKNHGDLEWEQYNILGQSASLGCVRLSVEDAKWIYDNCKVGTQVVVYEDAEIPGPLGKPEGIKIDPDSPFRGWDPTDPSTYNPWLIQKALEAQAEDTTGK